MISSGPAAAPRVFSGLINGESFTAVWQVLAPTLAPGDVVTLDNLGCLSADLS
jgi:hypothetical protein